MSIFTKENLLKSHAAAKNRFLYGLDCVPDEKLTWSPGGEAASPLGLADKLAGFLTFVEAYLRDQKFPERGDPPAGSATRDEAKARVGAAFDSLGAFVRDEVNDELLEKPIIAPWQTETTVRQMLMFAPTITGYFQGQMNYCQLAYGDTKPNVPPDWGHE